MKDLEIIIKDLQQELYELQKRHDQAVTLLCEAIDNLGDMPISESWADYWENKALKFIES